MQVVDFSHKPPPPLPGLESGSLMEQLSTFVDTGLAGRALILSAQADNCTSKDLDFIPGDTFPRFSRRQSFGHFLLECLLFFRPELVPAADLVQCQKVIFVRGVPCPEVKLRE